MGSFSTSPLAVAAANSDMRFLRGGCRYSIGGRRGIDRNVRWDRLGGNRRRLCRVGNRLIRGDSQSRWRFCTQRTASGTFRSRTGWKNCLPVLYLEVRNLLLDLRLEFVRGALEFVERLAHRPRDFRQLLGPKDDEGKKE